MYLGLVVDRQLNMRQLNCEEKGSIILKNINTVTADKIGEVVLLFYSVLVRLTFT